MSTDYEQVFSQFDDDVAEGIADVYRAEGYIDSDGEPSDQAMKDAAVSIVMSRAIVKSKAERSKKALTRGEFYSLVFPSGPGADDDAPTLDKVEDAVLNKLLGTVWGITQTKRTGHIQRQLAEAEGTTLVLCRTPVYRKATPMQAIYATDNQALILEDAVDKEIQSLVRRASSLRRDLNMILERHPELTEAVQAQLGVELQRIDKELTVPPAQQTLAAGATTAA